MSFVDRLERNDLVDSGIGENNVDLVVITLDTVVEPGQVGEIGDIALYADSSVADMF